LLESGEVLDEDLSPVHVQIPLGVEPPQIAGNQFADRAEFRSEALVTLGLVHLFG
jgi:hypothetical protein